MGILKGPVTARRYRVIGEVPDGFRVSFPEAMNAFAFREPMNKLHKGEVTGWVLSRNLLDTDFTDPDTWLFNQYAHFSLRLDKKSLPANLFRATLDKRVQAWCAENNRERAPKNVKEELKEKLEEEWLLRALPRVQVTEVAWNVADGSLWFGSLSDAANDRFRKLFHQTFGLKMLPLNPLELVGDLADALSRTGGSDLGMAHD